MEIRVTKYNPAYRDVNGYYDVNIDEWTEYEHIGQVFNGKEFTYEEYLETEEKYKLAVRLFLDEYNCKTIIIKESEIKRSNKMHLDEREKPFLETFKKIKEGSIISINELNDAVSLILRGLFWGVWYKLEDPSVNVRFGYDFYMYFEAPEINGDMFKEFKFRAPFEWDAKPKLGIRIQDTEEGTGVKVLEVQESSAAEKSGIKKDDVITSIDGKEIKNADEAKEKIAELKDKAAYPVKVLRNGSPVEVNVKIPKKLKTTDL